jgi:replicative DNA helicase
MTEPQHYQTASEVFESWRDELLSNTPPVFYPIGQGDLARLEIGPGLVSMFGGAPGAGKTAFVMQLVTDALRMTTNLKAVVCNVEMPPKVLLERQLARLSGIDLETIRRRRLNAEHAERIEQGLATIESIADRLCFVRPPFNLENIAACADAFEADILLLDYIQRISPPGEHGDKRSSVNATMDYLRQFADNEMAVMVVSAVGRTKDARGRTSYDGASLNLASFRESSELEFGCDDAFMLVSDPAIDEQVILRHLKSRHGRTEDLTLRFLGDFQRFESLSTNPGSGEGADRFRADLAGLWDRTEAADEEDSEGGDT